MLLNRRTVATLGLALGVAFSLSCTQEGQLMGPASYTPSFNVDGPECEVVDFSQFAHGDAITSLSLFGGEATVSVTAFRNDPAGAVDATAYDTELWDGNAPPNNTHFDTQRNIWCNDAANGGNGTCDGIMAVVPDANFASGGDDTQGGTITLNGFPGGFTWTLPSYAAVDDDGTQTISLSIDGSPVGASTGLGDASVETVTATEQPITVEAVFTLEGSGGVDNIEICREPEPAGVGRMTGGGGYIGMTGSNGEDVRVTHGFTIHCDVDLTNNLNINWPDNHVKIEKEFFLPGYPLCTDEPNVSPEPPPAPFDTFEGRTVGTLNGEAGAEIWFILQDAGEPGGKADMAAMQISFGGNVVLRVGDVTSGVAGLIFLEHGNLQAHFDQPHGCNVNKPTC